MFLGRTSHVRFLIRLVVYILAIIVLFLMRGRMDLKRFVRQMSTAGAADTTLVVSGGDLAPSFVEQMVANYRRDYPRLTIRVRGGGTTMALEDLINARAGVAFLGRPPLATEQRLFVATSGDTAQWFPIALGAILVIAPSAASHTTVTLADLRALADGVPGARAERLYVPDPNTGLWDAFRAKVGLSPALDAVPPGVSFLQDAEAVADAVRADPRALGVISAFALPAGLAQRGVRALSLRAAPTAAPVPPDVKAVVAGDYPLWSYLYVGCWARGGIQGSKFVTHLTSSRGQRQIARTDFLPVQQVTREVHLNRGSPGS